VIVADIGSGYRMLKDEIWRLVSGDRMRTLGREEQGLLTARQLVLRGHSTPLGKSIVTG
jgi:hypothetical protein